MNSRLLRVVFVAGAVLAGAGSTSAQQAAPTPPQPTVPELFTLMGQFVRVAYNNVGFVTLGYRVAQQSAGEEWLMLEVGMTVRGDNVTIKREHLSLKTPDGTIVPLATQAEYGKAGYLPAIHMRANAVRDSINYFPSSVTRGCPIQFFANLGQSRRQIAYDEVELSQMRACMGRLFFHVPGGIKYGQHWLLVKFGETEVQVPFRILTKDEAKEFEKTWQDLKKAHDEAMEQQ